MTENKCLKKISCKQCLKDIPIKYPALKKEYAKPILIEVFKELWYQRRRQLIFAAILFLLCFIIMIVFSVITLDMFFFTNFAIIAEMMGNHTRMVLYKWVQGAKYINDEVEKTEVCDAGPIESVVYGNGEEKFFECLEFLRKHVDVWYIDKPIIYMMGTGSLRITQYQNGTLTTDMFLLVQKLCNKKQWLIQKLSILSDQDESFYKWLTLNYKKRNFQKDSNGKNLVNSLSIVSMTREHLHIVYETTYDSEIVAIDGNLREINSKSYRCLGMQSLYNRYLSEEFFDRNSPILNCYHATTPLPSKDTIIQCPYYDAKNFTVRPKITLGDGDNCKQQIKNLINGRIQKLQIDKDRSYLLTDQFPGIFEFFKSTFSVDRTLASIRDASLKICKMNYAKIINHLNNFNFPPEQVCFSICYLVALFEEFKITEEEFTYFKLHDIINELRIDWTSGFTMQTKKNFPKFIFIVLNQLFSYFMVAMYVVIQITIIVLFLILLWRHFKILNKKLLSERDEALDQQEEKTQPNEVTYQKENDEKPKQ